MDTLHIWHGEDDRLFHQDDFLAPALRLLKAERRISCVCFRELGDAAAARRSSFAGRGAHYTLTRQRRLWGQKLTAARHLLAARLGRS